MDRSRSPRFRPGDRVSYQSQYNEQGERVDETLYGTVVRTDSSGVEVQFDGYDGTDGMEDDSELLEHAPSSTPTSTGSYTEAEMVSMLAVAADCSVYSKVKEINTLLVSKGVKPRGKKAQKCKQVALACSADEVQAFREEKEAEAQAAAKKQKRDPGQLTMKETVKRLRTRCPHDFVRKFPSGPRDNGEYHDVCRLCNATRE